MARTLKVGSLFSGGGLMDYALEHAGFTVAWQAEIDRDAVKVLGRHWPEGINYGDVTQVDTNQLSPVDLVAGGSPCQSFSFSGHRQGLAGESGLFWEFLRIADSQTRAWVLWENVPGVLSIDHGNTFALILWGFTGFYPQVPAGGWRNSGFCAGPKRIISWRVLDAEYFGVPQRRRRIFLVGHPVGRGDCAEILFEPDSLSGNSASGGQARQVTPTLLASGAGTARAAGVSANGFLVADESPDDAVWSVQLAHTIRTDVRMETTPTLDTNGSLAMIVPNVAATITAGGRSAGRRREDDVNLIVTATSDEEQPEALAWTQNQQNQVRFIGGDGQRAATIAAQPGAKQQTYLLTNSWATVGDDLSPTLQAQSSDQNCVITSYAARRLLPVEAERLQGIEDDWTRWDADGRELPDTARYRICGNGVAVPVVAWIARRIARAMAGEAVNP